MVPLMKRLMICFIFFAFLVKAGIHAGEEITEASGTLIVTYKTDKKGERLNRTRFWLRKEGRRLGFYPRETFFIEDRKEMSRMVVIDNLPVGNYQLQFLVPNLDGYFKEPALKEIVISDGEIFRIDQKIRRNDQPKTMLSRTPRIDPIEIRGFGSLILSYDWDKTKIKEVAFRLINTSGKAEIHPQDTDLEIPMDSGIMVHVPAIEEGRYRIEFFSREEANGPICILENVQISPNVTHSVHEEIKF